MRHLIKKAIVVLVVLGVAGGAAAWYFHTVNGQPVSYRTAKVTRGDIVVSISATGTVEPEEVVDVGAQVAGQILSFGKDSSGKAVDYGSVVKEGTVLAQIDDSLYVAEAANATAQVELANAGIQRARADLEQMKAKLQQAQRDWERAQRIGPSEALAQVSYDGYQSAYETAKANVAVGEAAILQAKAGLSQAEAVLRRAQRNLGYCTIKSPVKGVIIDRRVNTGQTVVASLNAPSLFLIAKDLTRMQVWVAVNEADIGKIHPGQPVDFTVDAFPGEAFRGEVGKVRLNASMTQNVVTYTVEVLTDNSSGRLLPYLTANAQFGLNRRTDVMQVPNAALRWTPQADQVAQEFREALQNPAAQEARRDGGQGVASKPGPPSGDGGRRGLVWAFQDQQLRPIRVRVGVSDGIMTEVGGEDLAEGQEIVVGEQSQSAAVADASNPFTPKIPRRPRGGGH